MARSSPRSRPAARRRDALRPGDLRDGGKARVAQWRAQAVGHAPAACRARLQPHRAAPARDAMPGLARRQGMADRRRAARDNRAGVERRRIAADRRHRRLPRAGRLRHQTACRDLACRAAFRARRMPVLQPGEPRHEPARLSRRRLAGRVPLPALRISAMTVEALTKPPVSDIDPFCAAFFEDPFPAHAALREAGPVVRLSRYDVWAVARYEQVHAILNDWQTFCSSRGAGLTDFTKETAWRPKSLVLETDPPLHDRTRQVLNRVLSASVMQSLRERFAEAAETLIDELLDRGRFDAITDLAEAYPLTVFPDAMGMPRENRHFLLPYGNMVFNSFGPQNAFFKDAVADAGPVLAWLQGQMQRDAFAPDGFGAAIHAASDAAELTEEEAPIVARSLLTAGVDTTVS